MSTTISSAQSLSCVQLFVTAWTAAGQASQSNTNSQSMLKRMSIKSVMHPTISSSIHHIDIISIYSSYHESESCSVVSDSWQPHWLYTPWNSTGQNTGVGSLSLLQGIFPTQGSNPGLPHCSQILYQLSHKGSLSTTICKLKINDMHLDGDTPELCHRWAESWQDENSIK